jgi:hypothetical protein
MAVRTAIRARVEGAPRDLTAVLQTLARHHLGLESFIAVAHDGHYMLRVLPRDPARTLDALHRAGISAEATQVAVVWLPATSASLARACDVLTAEGIKLDTVFLVSSDPARGHQLAFECDDAERADQLLWALHY